MRSGPVLIAQAILVLFVLGTAWIVQGVITDKVNNRHCDGYWAVGEGGLPKATCIPRGFKEQKYPTIQGYSHYTGDYFWFNVKANIQFTKNSCGEE